MTVIVNPVEADVSEQTHPLLSRIDRLPTEPQEIIDYIIRDRGTPIKKADVEEFLQEEGVKSYPLGLEILGIKDLEEAEKTVNIISPNKGGAMPMILMVRDKSGEEMELHVFAKRTDYPSIRSEIEAHNRYLLVDPDYDTFGVIGGIYMGEEPGSDMGILFTLAKSDIIPFSELAIGNFDEFEQLIRRGLKLLGEVGGKLGAAHLDAGLRNLAVSTEMERDVIFDFENALFMTPRGKVGWEGLENNNNVIPLDEDSHSGDVEWFLLDAYKYLLLNKWCLDDFENLKAEAINILKKAYDEHMKEYKDRYLK